MSGTSWNGGTTNWFTATNWNSAGGTHIVPPISATGTLSVTISGAVTTQPLFYEPNAPIHFTVTQNGNTYTDAQIDGLHVTLTSGASPTFEGVAIGHYGTDADGTNITNLTAAPSATPSFDSNMIISAVGTDTMIFNDVNHNFGLIEASGTGNDLNITVGVGGNVQTAHALFNYGEILATLGGTVTVDVLSPSTTGDSTNFGNAGYIVIEGGTFSTNTAITDGANVANTGKPDGYIIVGSAGSAILLGSVASSQEVVFADTLHNIVEIANNNSFSGTISGFGAGDTIQIAGVTNGTTLSYAGSILSVGELNSAGSVTTTVNIDVGTGYSASSFGALLSTSGVNIEAPTTASQSVLTFSATSGTINSFEDPTKYIGGIAPGNTIFSGETVIIAAGTASIASTSPVTNAGTLIVSGTGSTLIDTSTLVGTGIITLQNDGLLVLGNATGTDAGQNIVFGTGGTSIALNALDLTGSTLGFGGTISGFGLNDEIILGSAVLPSVATGSEISLAYAGSLLSVNELNSAGTITASSTLDVGTGYSTSSFIAGLSTNGVVIATAATAAEETLTFAGTAGTINSFEDPTKYIGTTAPGATIVSGESVVVSTGTASLSSTSPLTNGGNILVGTATFIDSSAIAGTGAITIHNSGQVTLANATGTDAGQTVIFGTGGTSLALNALDLTGSTLGFGGTISGFGLNDEIVLTGSVLPTVALGSQVSLAYTGSLLTVSELNSADVATAATTLDVGTSYSLGSFVALVGTGSVVIETPATAAETPLTFTGTAGSISSFEDPTKYTGGFAPGPVIGTGESIVISAGTASVGSTIALANNGTISVSGTSSALLDNSVLTGTGTVSLATGAQVTLANTTGTDTKLIYFGTGGTTTHPDLLDLNGTGTTSFGGTIANFGTFDTIVLGTSLLPGTETSFSTLVSGGIETLTVTASVSGTLHTDTLIFAAPPPGVFTVSNSSAGIVIADVPCFAAGTRILTPDGYQAVETLKQGDSVVTSRDGSEQNIIWVGQRTIDISRHAHPEKVQPIRILAGAFADAVPQADLRLSPDHALFIDGHLIEAKTLVNGVTIIQEKSTRFVTYHHIELTRHDVVLAEGLEAETYLDSANRDNFASDAGPLTLHANFAAQSRALACAPLLHDGDIVRAIREALLLRAQQRGFIVTDTVDLTVQAGEWLITPQPSENELLFVLPANIASVQLLCSTGVPAEVSTSPDDRRTLGAAVTALTLIANGVRHDIALDDAAHSGFHNAEAGHRWTDGAARIALPPYRGPAVLEVTINGQAARWARAA